MMLMADNTFKRYELKYMLDREQYEQIMSEMIRYMQPDRFAHSRSLTYILTLLPTGSSETP